MKICMIGGGYVGLVSAACFAELGWDVTCVDRDEGRVRLLQNGGVPIYEPDLDAYIVRNTSAGRLHFTTELGSAVSRADVVFLAVGTPMRRGDGHADVSDLLSAVGAIAPHLPPSAIITTKSTVPVGTSRKVEQILNELLPDAEFAVCSNPEFLREGSAIRDFMHPDRVLIGCDNKRAQRVMETLYGPLAMKGTPLMFVSRESAELSKYAANAFLALKISFINEVSDLCEKVGADVQDVARAIGRDRRIGEKFLQPGPGYGGSCFPKDVSALIRIAREAQAPLSLIEQVQHINQERKISMISRIERLAGGTVRHKNIAVLGVTFKPDTDDMREAPSLVIVPTLVDRGAKVRIYDPKGEEHGMALLSPGVTWANSALAAVRNADITVLLTEWNEFLQLDLSEIARTMRGRLLIDLRNAFVPQAAAAAGLEYHSIGRKSIVRRVRRITPKHDYVREIEHPAINGYGFAVE
jgi:UDPglucose 6-dehydrogenase